MENKEKWIVGISLAVLLFISLANSAAIRKNIKQSRANRVRFEQTWKRKEGEIKKTFQTAEKNFQTSKKNFEAIEERLDKMQQEILTARGELLKVKAEMKERIKNLKSKIEEAKRPEGKTEVKKEE
ncbi:MAG: hypothetical protein B5M48_02495 [Candidatus Omnitrophica bacterium 4484_213]|nr:MAG: hypothetical protein B5M48_02495 [Candidatus Omnitrophica bacterium 4484_213]